MQGLDPQDCRDLVKVLKKSAQQLEHASSQLNHAVARTGWKGPDSQRFRAQWPANRTRINHTARDLEDAATALLREIAEQERASAADGDGGGLWDDIVDAGKDLWDDFTEGVGNVVDGVKDGIGNAVDTVKDGLGWLAGEIPRMPVIRPIWNFAEQLGFLGKMGVDTLMGNPPSTAELVAQLALTTGTGINMAISHYSLGIVDLRLFDDGRAYAGDPIPVGATTSRTELTLPTSASSIFQGVVDAYIGRGADGTEDGEVRIVQVQQPDGSYAYIVNIPGTEDWGIQGGGAGRDLTSNLMVMAGQSSSAQEAVVLAMQKAGIPPGAPVMLAGHSQGGMLAVSLASDPQFMADYNVTNVLTAGSPVDGAGIDPRVNVLEVQHGGDLVPMLDLGGKGLNGAAPDQPSNVSVVTMDNPQHNAAQDAQFRQGGSDFGSGAAPWLPGINEDQGRAAGTAGGQLASNAVTNHDFTNYRDSMADTGRYPGIAEYENDPSMQVFLSNDPDKVSAVDIPTGRR